jgi:hypothetical protein
MSNDSATMPGVATKGVSAGRRSSSLDSPVTEGGHSQVGGRSSDVFVGRTMTFGTREGTRVASYPRRHRNRPSPGDMDRVGKTRRTGPNAR